jgi:hypothetical protein
MADNRFTLLGPLAPLPVSHFPESAGVPGSRQLYGHDLGPRLGDDLCRSVDVACTKWLSERDLIQGPRLCGYRVAGS